MSHPHTIRSIINLVRSEPIGQLQPSEPPNRQLSRTETSMLIEQVHGHRQDRPTVLGDANGAEAIQVYATGLFHGVRKGAIRWVTGEAVQAGLDSGVIVEVSPLDDTSTDETMPRDHVASPTGSPFEPNPSSVSEVGLRPVPEATDVDRGLADMSKSELVKIAQEVDLPGRSSMDKSELYEHLRHLPEVEQHLP